MAEIRVLVVDDEESFRTVVCNELQRMGFHATAAANGQEALQRVSEERPEVALVDLAMPGMDGLQLLELLAPDPQAPEIIVVTGNSSVDSAVAAMKAGAADYVTKPFHLEELETLIRKAYHRRQLAEENRMFRRELAGREDFPEILGQSPALRGLLEVVGRVAASDTTTLITGESGSGKELVARAVHKNSRRRDNPFIVVDCCSLQPNLLENELFGHEAGAYTGATRLKHGLFEVADTGTLFMDEIAEIGPEIQAKLLRVLETGTFRRVGSTRVINVDVRLLAATSRDLRQLMDEGKFRRDLFYRLNILVVKIPPLRERREDIGPLARHFLAHSRAADAERKSIAPEAMEALVRHDWPGNVRELRNALERAAALAPGDSLTPGDFGFLARSVLPGAAPAAAPADRPWKSLAELERDYILATLEAVGGNRRKAAERLGISERNLYRKLRGFPGKKF